LRAPKSIEECKEKCLGYNLCTAVSFDKTNRVCYAFYGYHYKGGDVNTNYVSWTNCKNYHIRNVCLSNAARTLPMAFVYSRCEDECERDPQCKGSTFYYKEKKCTLHNDIDGVTQDGDCNTWMKHSTPGLAKGICLTNGYTDEETENSEDCKANCLQDDKCRACGFNADTKKCTKATRAYSLSTGSQCESFIPIAQIDLRHGLCLTNEYEAMTKKDVIDCYETCGDDSRCKAMTYNSNTKNCQLLDDKFKNGETSNSDCETWISSKLVPYPSKAV